MADNVSQQPIEVSIQGNPKATVTTAPIEVSVAGNPKATIPAFWLEIGIAVTPTSQPSEVLQGMILGR